MPLLEKLGGPLMAAITHRLQVGADHHLRRFLFDERLRGRLCAQLETLAAAHGVAEALDVEPDTDDRDSMAFCERFGWILKHADEVERLAAIILKGTGER
jgi:hypothetical protein